MPTPAVLQENKAWLQSQDYSVEIISQPSRRVQWYRADGTPLPNLLPCDPYHLRQFRSKGWTLRPVQRTTNAVESAVDVDEAPVAMPPPNHLHRYGAKAVGAPCKVNGCTAMRIKPFTSHKKKR